MSLEANVMYRVSTALRQRTYLQNSNVFTTDEYDQCGAFYYFQELSNACKAAMKYNTSIVPVNYCHQTDKCDDWYST